MRLDAIRERETKQLSLCVVDPAGEIEVFAEPAAAELWEDRGRMHPLRMWSARRLAV